MQIKLDVLSSLCGIYVSNTFRNWYDTPGFSGNKTSQTVQEENVKFSIILNDKLGRNTYFVRTIYTNQLNNNLKAMLDLNLVSEFW